MFLQRSNENKVAAKAEQQAPGRKVAPLVDVFENQDEVIIMADLPGVSEKDLSVAFDKNRLSFSATRSSDTARQPIIYERAFVVTEGIDSEKISARLNRGVLTIHLPRSVASRPRKIPVTASS